jgi:hypothetical protein
MRQHTPVFSTEQSNAPGRRATEGTTGGKGFKPPEGVLYHRKGETMSTITICWGHNPGQRFVKDTITSNDTRKDLRPYPAVIAPWACSDDTGLVRKSKDLTASVGGAYYIGGAAAERLPLANRQMASGRLDADSPMYQALVQMSLQHIGLTRNGTLPRVVMATALPVGWRDEAAEEALKAHIREGLRGLVTIAGLYVQSEPNAVISHELLDDAGQIRTDQAMLAKGLVCVGDIGGSTLNRSVLEGLRALPGQSDSPLLGSRQVVEALMHQSGAQYVDAERRLEAAVKKPGSDVDADRLLKQYREAVVAELQRTWAAYRPVAYLFAGGTAHWLADDLRRAFTGARVVANPQQAIAIGLWRYARRKARQGA